MATRFLADPALATIDSLLWTQPDSAFVQLQGFAGSHEVDSLDPFNRHYFHLLLSELLYKNDYAQTNRDELLRAVDYYDSLVAVGGTHVDKDIVFLDARAHYIDGVGYYEMDSVVPACQHYLTAVELMEERFSEKELTGKKAQFMALAYTHLTALFSDQYLHEQAIHYGKQALSYFNKIDSNPWHVSWMLDEIGLQFDMLDQWDSAFFYYNRAHNHLSDTVDLNYRDNKTHLLQLSYKRGLVKPQTVLSQLQSLLDASESDKEYYARCLTIGNVYYCEEQYDSAWVYLNKVFHGAASSTASKRQAAEWLVHICKELGDKEESEYANFLVPFANSEENKSAIKTQLTGLYSTHVQNKQDRSNRHGERQIIKWQAVTVIGIALLLMVAFIYYQNKRKLHHKEELENERHLHEKRQEALEKEKKDLLHELKEQHKHFAKVNLEDFVNEPICQEIIGSLQDVYIKRDAKSDAYPELWLDDIQLSKLLAAAERHFHGFSERLTKKDARITSNEINQCLLYLLNLNDVQIAALLQCDYTTIKKRSAKLKNAFGTKKTLQVFIRELVLK
jgi:tetratricopeptide (TPR) repeat protein